jgi:hypothetical protein
MMMIFTLILIVVLIEAGLYGICCFLCRERHVPGDHPPPRSTQVVDFQKAWPPPTDHQSNRHENNARLVCCHSHISSLRDCE